MKFFVICQFCGTRIDLHDRKDFESMSMIEVADHIKAEHPEQVRPFGIPYHEMEIED